LETREIPQHLPETVSLLDRLRMAIFRGELTPGQRLVETELASRYETSRGSTWHCCRAGCSRA
jgi:DNA-binding GntR family transcriptional regulator